jgi:hypothetical protein
MGSKLTGPFGKAATPKVKGATAKNSYENQRPVVGVKHSGGGTKGKGRKGRKY